jgi:hypothetical protein
MIRQAVTAALGISVSGMLAQPARPRQKFDAFEVATIKPVDPDARPEDTS